MDAQKLVKMANAIAGFFESDPDPAARVEGIASHIRRFWEPRMRIALYKHHDEAAGEGLKPTVIQVLKERREQLLPATTSESSRQ